MKVKWTSCKSAQSEMTSPTLSSHHHDHRRGGRQQIKPLRKKVFSQVKIKFDETC